LLPFKKQPFSGFAKILIGLAQAFIDNQCNRNGILWISGTVGTR
jgi:hypothetical protein